MYPEGEETKHWNEAAIPFWIIGSDGVTRSKPKKRNIIVLSGGQREEILLQFDKPGKYVISQQGIQGMQFFDMLGHPHDAILSTITVTEAPKDIDVTPTMPIANMTFTPGYTEEESISPEEIVGSETIVFSMGSEFDKAPFPQYFVNGKPFDPNQINFHAKSGEAREYILINANHNAHPFHIHVNRFQVKKMSSGLSSEKYPVLESVLDHDPDAWRDTFMVPPNGKTEIWVKFKEYTGKTVLHCHFLAHEDTGMMSTLFIGEEDFVFRLKDHMQWIVGSAIGVIVSFLFFHFFTKKSRDYSAVSMNELKSKARD